MGSSAATTTVRPPAAATDPHITRWQVQIFIGLGYLAIAAASVVVSHARLGIVLVTIAAWLLQWVMLWLAYRAFLARPWWRRHPRLTASMILGIIIVASVITIIAFPEVGGTDGWTILWRFAITLLVTWIIVVLSQYRDDIVHERSVVDDLQRARGEGVLVVQRVREDVVERLLLMLQQAFDAMSHQGAGAEHLSQFAREQVRPLSHELSRSMPPLQRGDADAAHRYAWRDVLSDITAKPLVRPLPIALAVTMLFIFATVQTTSAEAPAGDVGGPGLAVSVDVTALVVGLGALAVVFVATWLGAVVAVRVTTPMLPRLGLGARVTLAAGTVVAIGLLVVLIVHSVVLATSLEPQEAGSIVRRIWISVPIVAVAFVIVVARSISSLLGDSSRRLRELTAQLEWENARAANALSQERQFFATQLHGPIQSAAAAAALRLESSEVSSAALEQVRADLSAAIQALGHGPEDRRLICDQLDRLVGTWAGVCEVHIDMPDSIVEALDADWIASGTTLDLLVDAVANAVMHGGAGHVWIGARWVAVDELGITVVNDGDRQLGDERGLGTALLDSTCMRWSREQIDSGVRLEAVVAVGGLGVGIRT